MEAASKIVAASHNDAFSQAYVSRLIEISSNIEATWLIKIVSQIEGNPKDWDCLRDWGCISVLVRFTDIGFHKYSIYPTILFLMVSNGLRLYHRLRLSCGPRLPHRLMLFYRLMLHHILRQIHLLKLSCRLIVAALQIKTGLRLPQDFRLISHFFCMPNDFICNAASWIDVVSGIEAVSWIKAQSLGEVTSGIGSHYEASSSILLPHGRLHNTKDYRSNV